MTNTVGDPNTPSGVNFFSQGVNNGDQVGTIRTMPTPGGLLTKLWAYAATFTGTATPTLCVWDGSGNLLMSGAGSASVGASSPAWVSYTPGTPLFVSGGATIIIGWANPAANGFYAAYNAVTATTDWNAQASPPAAMSSPTQQTTTSLGAYAEYTPSQLYIDRSGTWTAGEVQVFRSSVWTPAPVYVYRSGVWQPAG